MRPRGTPITAGRSRLDIETAKRIAPATAAAIASATPIASRRPEAPAKVPAAIASPTPWQIARKRLMSAKRLAPHTQTGRRPSGFASAEAGGPVAPRELHLERAIGLDVQLRATAKLRALRVHDDPREILRVELQDVLEILGMPYTGPGVASCIRCMDKVLAKHLFRAAGIPTPDWVGRSTRPPSGSSGPRMPLEE